MYWHVTENTKRTFYNNRVYRLFPVSHDAEPIESLVRNTINRELSQYKDIVLPAYGSPRYR